MALDLRHFLLQCDSEPFLCKINNQFHPYFVMESSTSGNLHNGHVCNSSQHTILSHSFMVGVGAQPWQGPWVYMSPMLNKNNSNKNGALVVPQSLNKFAS